MAKVDVGTTIAAQADAIDDTARGGDANKIAPSANNHKICPEPYRWSLDTPDHYAEAGSFM